PLLTTTRGKDVAIHIVAEEDHAEAGRASREQRRRQRQQEAGTVARLAVGGDGASVLGPARALEARVQDLARRAPAGLPGTADAACSERDGRGVQALRCRQRAPFGRISTAVRERRPVVLASAAAGGEGAG